MSSFKRRIALAIAVCIALPLVVVAPALADDVAAHVTGFRGSALPVIQVADQAAAGSAAAQAAANNIFHADVSGLLGPCESVAEVVGSGPNVPAVFAAFRESSSHRSIILNPDWTGIGTGLAHATDGTTYVSVVFCREPVAVAQPANPGLPPGSTQEAVPEPPGSAPATDAVFSQAAPVPALQAAPAPVLQATAAPVLQEALPAIGARRGEIRERLDREAKSKLPAWYTGICGTVDRGRVLEGNTVDSGACPKAS